MDYPSPWTWGVSANPPITRHSNVVAIEANMEILPYGTPGWTDESYNCAIAIRYHDTPNGTAQMHLGVSYVAGALEYFTATWVEGAAPAYAAIVAPSAKLRIEASRSGGDNVFDFYLDDGFVRSVSITTDHLPQVGMVWTGGIWKSATDGHNSFAYDARIELEDGYVGSWGWDDSHELADGFAFNVSSSSDYPVVSGGALSTPARYSSNPTKPWSSIHWPQYFSASSLDGIPRVKGFGL